MRVRVKNPQCGPRLLACDPSPAATYAALIVVCEPLLILHCLPCHQTLFIRSYPPLFFTGSLSPVFRLLPLSPSLWKECMPECVAWRYHDSVEETQIKKKAGERKRGNNYDIGECVFDRVLGQFYQVRQKPGAST